MAKKSMIARQNKRLRLCQLYEEKRAQIKEKRRKASKLRDTFFYGLYLHEFPRNSSAVRLNRRCLVTGRPKAVYRKFSLSRHVFREMAHQCLLPGITKSSW